MAQRHNLLIVDDDAAMREMLVSLFTDHGYAVREASMANAALDLARDVEFDVVLSDIKMPGKSGLSKKKDHFSVNVVYFAPMDTGIPEHEEGRFKKFVSLTKGQLRVLDGLEAIESSIAPSE